MLSPEREKNGVILWVTEKGFGGGFGCGQMQQLMKASSKMQEDIQKAQKELEEAELEGATAGSAVKVVVSGKRFLKSVNIDSSVIDPDDAEMLERPYHCRLQRRGDQSRRNVRGKRWARSIKWAAACF